MATLVSPGVSVTITDESFFIPAAAATVPLLFIATADEKFQPDGVTPAAGTYEYDVVRTVTSLTQSTELYGIPRFLADSSGNQYHGDARNEYGLFALNQFLGVGDLAYVVRANVNLNDNFEDIQALWDKKIQEAGFVLENLVNDFLNEFNTTNGYIPSNPNYKQTVTSSEYLSLANEALEPVFDSYSFRNTENDFLDDNSDPASATAGYQVVEFGEGYTGSGNKILSSGIAFASVENAFQELKLPVLVSGSPLTQSTGLTGSPATTYTMIVNVNGTNQVVSFSGSSASTYADLLAQINADLVGATASIVTDGATSNLRITSLASGSSSSIAITPGSNLQTDLGATLGSAIATTIGASSPTNLRNDGTVYNLDVTVDGSLITTSILGQNAQTYTDLINEINIDLASSGEVKLYNGQLLFVSASTGATSTVVVTAGTGNDMLQYLGVSVGGAIPGSPNNAAGDSGDHPTGLANDSTIYTASVNIDGLVQNVQITGSAAQTFNDLVTELQTDLGLATVAITDGNIEITSNTTGATSSVVITDGTLFTSVNFFVQLQTPVYGQAGDSPLPVFGDGFELPQTGTYLGLEGNINDWVNLGLGSVVPSEFTAEEASGLLTSSADDFKWTVEFLNQTSLGANDAARRVAITTALQATINSNTDIRSENFEFNLVLCPGYHEAVDELLALVVDIQEEAFVIADTPVNQTPSETVTWAGSTERQSSTNVAYYYPWALASNLDGVNVTVAPSGVALRTYAYSDSVSELWFAPAGTRRGLISGITNLGYVTGTLGSATTFVEVALNQGQRDDLYKYFTNTNPLVFFPGRGFLVWGQKTAAPAASALDRVNVSRLVKYIKRQLRKNSLPFVFQPNDALTRDDFKASIDRFLGDLVVKRGLYDYATVCDESNNTPDRIDRNEMYADVAIKPVRAAEFIFIPIRVVATDAEI